MAGPRSEWGWHALDPEWARRIVADAGVQRGELVLDIGAGTGALTAELVRAGAYVIAIELHPDRLAVLRQRFTSGVRVVRADARDLRLPRRPFRVVANPPFGATSAVLSRLVHHGSRLTRADLVLQDAAAHRWASARAPGARTWWRTYDVVVGARVPRDAFRPAPAVGARVLTLHRR
ncbi:MAG: rRNA adenine N(6)-methyltransferase family protein [Ilumatobacteraceae bacterium]